MSFFDEKEPMKKIQHSDNSNPFENINCSSFMKTKFRLCLSLVVLSGVCSSTARAADVIADNLTVHLSASGVLPSTGARYVIVEQQQGETSIQRGGKLLAAYAKAKLLSPAVNNRITVFIPPGDYNLGSTG